MMHCLLSNTIHLHIHQDTISKHMTWHYLEAGATVKPSKSWDFIEVHGLAEAFKPATL